MTLRYVHNTENVVFLGPPGVGKTHLSVALGMRAIMSDIPVYYTSAMKLVQILKRDYDLKRLEYRIKTYSRFRLMIVDEIGYLPLSREEANLFFQFVSSRYEKRSTIYTSNKSFSEWGEVLGDQVMACAVLDRILHHCVVINIRGDSYRLKDRRKNPLPTERRGEKNECKVIWGGSILSRRFCTNLDRRLQCSTAERGIRYIWGGWPQIENKEF